ncbi:MAG: GMC family oxidoreductase, partial [Lysobacter sp.]
NVRVLLHANLTGLQAAPGGSAVEEARIATLDGKRGRVRARHYVLAAGGIENARLLLLSDSVVPQGLGNDRDVVGRYFMDHPSGKLGTIVTDKPETLTRPYDRNLAKGPLPSHPEICLAEEAQQEHRILNARLRPFAVEGSVPKGIQALRGLKAARRAKTRDWELSLKERLCIRHNGEPQYIREAAPPAESTARLAMHLGLGVGDLAWAVGRKLAGKPAVKTGHVDVVGYFEQAPNPESRITLGSETDALGLRRVCVDWRLNSLDMRTYRVAARLFGDELARVCNGRFELEPWLRTDDNPTPEVFGTSHHMGTTRMSDDPASGVVDRNCKVHGVDNLHVAGSSVFPAGGWAFPTFTIVALGLRLAGHLRARLEQSPVDLAEVPVRQAVA